MKITKSQLKQIIKEEIKAVLGEASQEDVDREFDCKAKMRETLPKEEWSGPKGAQFMKDCRDGRLEK